MIRKTIFWAHLISGVTAGLVIFMMSITGVLLTYERQIEKIFQRNDYLDNELRLPTALPIDKLIVKGEYVNSNLSIDSVIVTNHPGAPLTLRAGRTFSIELNPFTGEEMHIGSPHLENFFRVVTNWHRWFNTNGDDRVLGRAITGLCNLIFLFLIFSGLYLWLPKTWRWFMFKIRLKLYAKPPNGRARDYNWHHFFGIWCAVPLAVIVATATVFNYSWANNLVYQVYGEEVPQRSLTSTSEQARIDSKNVDVISTKYLNLNELLQSAQQYTEQIFGNWETISIALPAINEDQVIFEINQSLGGQPQKQFTLTLDRNSGEQLSLTGLSDASPAQRARRIIRFLHTGEVLGFWGQTIAGVVSFATLLMVWSGLALAYRRLIKPLFTFI
ncbi:MAG: PepSY-associated TM helix domain-containing protein [Pseudohongiellaceae bacterium]